MYQVMTKLLRLQSEPRNNPGVGLQTILSDVLVVIIFKCQMGCLDLHIQTTRRIWHLGGCCPLWVSGLAGITFLNGASVMPDLGLSSPTERDV